jgi:hypothetical protein
MINILYNSDHPELIFAIATFMLNLDEKHKDEICDIIPFKTINLNDDLFKYKIDLDNEIKIVTGEKYFDNPEDTDTKRVKYALFGIYPKNEEETQMIASFFDDQAERIMLWLDWHSWPANLLSFLEHSDRIHVDEIKTCLEVMEKSDYFFPPEWLEAEKAMISKNSDNKLAARYWKKFLEAKSIGKNLSAENGSDYIFFSGSINEIADGQENEIISEVEEAFEFMVMEMEEVLKKFDDNNPIFAEAKKIGRPVGVLVLGEVPNYFNTEDILSYGREKFPWLCILRYTINNIPYIYFDSEKIPVAEIARKYQCNALKEIELLKILNNELLSFKEK